MNDKISLKDAFFLSLRCLKDVNHYVPGRLPALILASVCKALAPYVTIWFSARLIDELAGLRRPDILFKWALLTVCTTGVMALVSAAANRWKLYTEHIHNPYKEKIFSEKFFAMDYQNLDNQRIRDQYSQISQNERWLGWGINQTVIILEDGISAVAGILGAAALTVSLFIQRVPAGAYDWLNSPLSVLALLGIMMLIIWFSTSCHKTMTRKLASLSQEATMENRLYTALLNLCEEKNRRLDIRTYNQQNMAEGFIKGSALLPGGSFDKLGTSLIGMLSYLSEGCAAVFTGAVYVFTCLKAWAGAFSIGSVTQYVGAVTTLSGNVARLMKCTEDMRSNGMFLKQAYDFLDIPNTMYQGSLTTEKRSDRQYQVEFRDVSFKYPGASGWALRHVNMKFQIGKRLAIVGENGSGKTTFIKLLCRLYDPQEGQILLNGIDIRKYRYDDYMQIFSVVFQDLQLISQPLGANVAGSCHYDRERVEKALEDAGFGERLSEMPQGLDTMLYKDFAEDGVEISGGEAQKIAIARALYKDAPFIILDEPTAALDPIAEAEIYSKFNEISGDRTAIYISHRLSSCKFCDEIAVFDHGRVIQQGSHEGLLQEKDGKYAALWNAQAQYYTV